jgi:hypothetical protein
MIEVLRTVIGHWWSSSLFFFFFLNTLYIWTTTFVSPSGLSLHDFLILFSPSS